MPARFVFRMADISRSKLDSKKDVLIIGASKLERMLRFACGCAWVAHGDSCNADLEDNVHSALKGKPLPDNVVKAMDEAAALAKPSWPSYHR